MENQMKTVRKDAPDVLDLDNSPQIGGGGVGDAYCEDSASENQTFTPWTRVVASGLELLRDPRYNKGTAFSEDERERHYLRELLPPVVISQDLQIHRTLQNVRSYETDLEKYVEVMDLQERNERLFYKVLIDHVEELLPIVYTPTVGEACQKHGLYITLKDRSSASECLKKWREGNVEVIVVTGGEGILGFGDPGLQSYKHCYIFPDLGLRCVIPRATRVHDHMLLDAAKPAAWEVGEASGRSRDMSADMGAMEKRKPKRRVMVAVTGAGGFIASWIVKLLLQRGFFVRGTLRNLDDESTAHLRGLEGARERLELLRADILHPPSLEAVVQGCEGVFHTACPVPPAISDPEAQMLRPAVEGTLNVLRACAQARVRRVVMTSSIGAVYMNPGASPDQVVDESCWSDENHLRDCKEWYCLAKLMAERAAWDYAAAHNLDLVTICPAVTLGTMLQPHINQSSTHILKYLNGSTKTYANLCQAYVDVEDAAKAHILAFVTQSASGRILCCRWTRHRSEIVSTLACLYPQYPIPTRCKEEGQSKKLPIHFCNQKAEQLGVHFTSFDETLRRTVVSLQAKGILQNTIATAGLSKNRP